MKVRHLDTSVGHPGSTSDHLGFVTSKLQSNLEKPVFLAPRLVLCGDNTCVSNEHMATPFKNVSSGSKDAYNFYQ